MGQLSKNIVGQMTRGAPAPLLRGQRRSGLPFFCRKPPLPVKKSKFRRKNFSAGTPVRRALPGKQNITSR